MFSVKKSLAAATIVAASVAYSGYAAAQNLIFNSAGSSAQWQTFALAAQQVAHRPGNYTIHHYTIKGKAADGKSYAAIVDSRTTNAGQNPPNATPPAEGGNLWVVYNEDSGGNVIDIWAYTSVDSVVGLRSFFAVPRARIVVDPSVTSTPGLNLIAAALWGNVSDDTALPQQVYNTLNNATLTAANTDIRPEDGLFAFNRAVANPANTSTTSTALGYGSGANVLIGNQILSHYSTAAATPVAFALTGADPITGQEHPTSGYTTIPVGASPVVFIVNKTIAQTGHLGQPGLSQNLPVVVGGTNVAYHIFGGTLCNFHGVTVNPVLREPLSGTMNTTEFTNFRIFADGNPPTGSQEHGISPSQPNNNPLNLTCPGSGSELGTRTRAIGTGESVAGVQAGADAIGYAFFGYGNFSKIAGSPSYGYLTLDGVDPINASFTNGQLPPCPNGSCPKAGGTSFPNLRNGTYRSWSLLRVVTDGQGTTNYTNTSRLAAAAQALVNTTTPDFVPFSQSCSASGPNEPGLDVYRQHFNQSGVTANDGSLPSGYSCPAHPGAPAQHLLARTLGGGVEAGGDVGGVIEGPFPSNPTPYPGPTGARQ